MRWRGLFFFSLGVNIVLAALCGGVILSYLPRRAAAMPERTLLVKTNSVVRKQFFSWSEVESPDYPTYIANLRAINCPEQTVRDIIIADVNALFSKRLATEIISPSQQWWRAEPDPEVVRAASEKMHELEAERRDLLTRLLGPNWESGDLVNIPRPTHPGVALDGPVLGLLSADAKQAVQDINTRASDRLQAYLDAQKQAGKSADPVEIAKLRKQTRDELARILVPSQLEEYLLRYSQEANDLRGRLGDMKFFNASPDEFRALFRATDSFDQQLQMLPASDDPNVVAQRNSLEQQRDAAIKTALGASRYEQFQLLQDPAYQDAYAAAQQAGNPDAAMTIYQINQAAAEQEAAIRARTNLSPAQLAVALQQARLDQLKANAQALGDDLPDDPAVPPPPMPAVQPVRPYGVHAYTVGTAESAASIATRYGISMDALSAANPDLDLRRLRPGDAVMIPSRPTPSSQ